MGHRARKKRNKRRSLDQGWEREIPYCAIIKSAFFRDFMTNMELLMDTLPPHMSVADSMDRLFQSLRLDGYEITRDGDSILVRDHDGQMVFDAQSIETEAAIIEAADRAESQPIPGRFDR